MTTAGITSPITPDTASFTLFSQAVVRVLRDNDFALDSKDRIIINHNECILVLFYTNDEESKEIADIWGLVAKQVAGPIFAACNLFLESKVALAFQKLANEPNNPLNSFSMKGIPFIIVYRDGWPKAFYNGNRSVGAIADYALTLACVYNYNEPVQLTAGVHIDNSVGMAGWSEYKTPRTNSTQYISGSGIRQFNSIGIVPVNEATTGRGAALVPGQEQKQEVASAAAGPVVISNIAATTPGPRGETTTVTTPVTGAGL